MGSRNSGYHHNSFNHSLVNFGAGVLSTSHIEVVWNIIKANIKNTYYVIPKKILFSFNREAEYKYTFKDKNYEKKFRFCGML